MKIFIELTPGNRDTRIALRSGWAPGIPELCKSVPGGNWSKVNKQWTYPLTTTTCRIMRDVFGQDLVIGPALSRWARQAIAHETVLQQLGRQTDSELRLVPEVAPHLYEAMSDRTYQRVGARFGAIAGSWLCADEPSLGKTATAIASIMEAGAWEGQHLVIAPKTALDGVWGRQLKMWGGEATQVTVLPEGKPKREKALQEFFSQTTGARFLVVNPAVLRTVLKKWCKACEAWEGSYSEPDHHIQGHKGTKIETRIISQDWPQIINHQWSSVVLDESHDLLAAYTQSNVSQTVEGLLRIKSERRVALTGTPLRGQERRYWGTLNWLDPKEYRGFWQWAESYFNIETGVFGSVVHGIRADREEAFYRSIDKRVLRRTKREVRSDLPEAMPNSVWVQPGNKQKKQYQEFLEMGEVALEEGSISSMGVLSELTRLRQMSWGVWTMRDGKLRPTEDSPKLEVVLQMLKERGITGKAVQDWTPEPGEGFKCVIASQFTEIIDLLETVLNKKGISTYKLTGAASSKKRKTIQDNFQSEDDEVRVCLIQTKTGGVAIELDAWCDEMLILDQTYINDDTTQLVGRIDNRSGRVAPRTYHFIRTLGTIEETLAESNIGQEIVQHNLLDGRRGIEMARKLIQEVKKNVNI